MRAKFLVSSAVLACSLPVAAEATVVIMPTPTYGAPVGDCVTNTNHVGSRWFIGKDCDSYQNEVYERPTTQTYTKIPDTATTKNIYGANEYRESIDIRQARVGADDEFLYVGIEMVGLDRLWNRTGEELDGLVHQYMFLISTAPDGQGGHLFQVDQPALVKTKVGGSEVGGEKNKPNTVFNPEKTTGHHDATGNNANYRANGKDLPDVGGSGNANGLSITKSDSLMQAEGNGYDLKVIGDGQLQTNAKPVVLYARINPLNPGLDEVEFALRYSYLGYDRTKINSIIAGNGFLDFRAVMGDPNDPQKALWNDEFTFEQSGTPYFGQIDLANNKKLPVGLKGAYLVDTLRYKAPFVPPPPPPVPEPATWLMMIAGFGGVGVALRRSRRRAQRAALAA